MSQKISVSDFDETEDILINSNNIKLEFIFCHKRCIHLYRVKDSKEVVGSAWEGTSLDDACKEFNRLL